MPKPVHPAVVHFPLAFLILAFGLDIVHSLSPKLPQAFSSKLAPSTDLTRASYFLLSAGLLTGVPALVTGGREAVMLIAKQGMWESDSKGESVVRTKVKAMIAHAVVNDLVLGLTTLVWYKKRQNATNTLAGKMGVGSASTGAAAYQASTWMVFLEAFLFVGLIMGANIGGSLTYIFGIGFNAGGNSGKKKQ
ncbi:hypothetical protein LTR37_000158 [Vermiconidia calcicola]|uniref:Uncharacterized protein n=1 Tax=Vermiconidia calcicola TaxID=1690605 RepID=A0ACC3NZ18_9PEZI|nr:hypothetical protein LTR37_000158 [Vermiconidia calcicola]